MPGYLFWLGHQPHLSSAELAAVFSARTVAYTISAKRKQFLLVETQTELDATQLMRHLGGVVKIARQLRGQKQSLTPANYLAQTQPEGKIIFSTNDKRLALTLKKELCGRGRAARYIEPKNTATILHNHLVEKQADLTLFDHELYVTSAIQPIAEFSQRDYDRPGRDAASGLLPPKLAKIMINLAGVSEKATLLDPFCGSGTILMEAAVMGYKNLIGSDISRPALKDTKNNLDWLQQNFKLPAINYQLFHARADQLEDQLPKRSVHAIVTEPYLGKPLTGAESEQFLKKQAAELARLYLGAFRSFYKILKPAGVVVFIIPAFRYKKNWITPDCVKLIKDIGFAPRPLLDKQTALRYHRPAQHLARDIWKFQVITTRPSPPPAPRRSQSKPPSQPRPASPSPPATTPAWKT